MPAFLEFAGAFAAFLISHRLPARKGIRGWLVSRLGETTYRVLYSALSIILLGWLISAAIRAPVYMLWSPRPWHAMVPLVVMPIALILILAAALSPNPLSISLRSANFDPTRPGIVAVTRHPMLWGFALWAAAHVVANGDLVSVALFGGLSAFALHGLVMLDQRMKQRLGDTEWQTLANKTSIIPFAAWLQGKTKLSLDGRLAAAIVASIALYIWIILQGHELLFGVDPLARLQP